MRFVEPVEKPVELPVVAFNSLYEIPKMGFWERLAFLNPFNSLYEIHGCYERILFGNYYRLSILFMRFL